MGPGVYRHEHLLLLSSGATITWAHWGLKAENNQQLVRGLIATIVLGLLFVIMQAYEYGHAYSELNLDTGLRRIWFHFHYMLTGFPRLPTSLWAQSC